MGRKGTNKRLRQNRARVKAIDSDTITASKQAEAKLCVQLCHFYVLDLLSETHLEFGIFKICLCLKPCSRESSDAGELNLA